MKIDDRYVIFLSIFLIRHVFVSIIKNMQRINFSFIRVSPISKRIISHFSFSSFFFIIDVHTRLIRNLSFVIFHRSASNIRALQDSINRNSIRYRRVVDKFFKNEPYERWNHRYKHLTRTNLQKKIELSSNDVTKRNFLSHFMRKFRFMRSS